MAQPSSMMGAFVYDYTRSEGRAKEQALRVCATLATRMYQTAAPGEEKIAREMVEWVRSKPEWVHIQKGTVWDRLDAMVAGKNKEEMEPKEVEQAFRDNAERALELWRVCFERNNANQARRLGAVAAKVGLFPGHAVVCAKAALVHPDAGVVLTLLEIIIDFLAARFPTWSLEQWSGAVNNFFEPVYFQLIERHPTIAPNFRVLCRERLQAAFALVPEPAPKRKMADRGASKEKKSQEDYETRAVEWLKKKFRTLKEDVSEEWIRLGDVRNSLRGALYERGTPIPPDYLPQEEISRLVGKAFGEEFSHPKKWRTCERYKIKRIA